MNDQGWVKLHRKLLSWEWHDDPNTGWLFMTCLMMANHEDNKWHGVVVKKGSFITSIANLAKQAGLSPQQTRTSLNKLKSTNEITNESTSLYTVITIQKWDDYQASNKRDNKRITNEQQTNNKPITTNKNEKNEKNILPKGNIVQKKPDAQVDFILDQFYKYAEHRPIDKSPRHVAYTFKQQINHLIKDIAPYKSLTFEEVVHNSFQWYREKNDDAQARYLNTVRKNVTEILFEGTRRKYIKSSVPTYDQQK